MRKLSEQAEFGDNLMTWILLFMILFVILVFSLSVVKEHDNLHSHMVSERKALQSEITKLRKELKAHDEKPYLFERKE